MGEQTGSLFNVKEKDIIKIHQCFTCQKWKAEKLMHPVEVPSQGSEYVTKLICQDCMLPISIDIERLGKDQECLKAMEGSKRDERLE